ncbi:MAG: helix-turn-helix domain-containing protein [Tissierellia bacterium]|nr:helix-turn-helix domain-containing protein [Tissierellia bacterium]
MYPLYWTTSKEGILMKYSYEFKKECVQLYRVGKWPDTPEGIKENNFHKNIRIWVRLEDIHGPEILKHGSNTKWTADEKLELVSKVIAGNSIKSVAIEAGIHSGQLHSWVNKYKDYGYNGLVNKKKGPKSNNTDMKRKINTKPKELNESEREELVRLRAENEYIKAENEVIKKEIALREKNYAAQLKAKKQQLSKNSEKKDTN